MNNLEINKKVAQLLNEFEIIETISVSDNWENRLQLKLNSKQNLKLNYSKKYGIILVVLFFFNTSLILFSTSGSSEKIDNAKNDFQIISNELFINSK